MNKAISMMREKSQRSDVEMLKKTKFPGGHFGFLSAFLDLKWVLDKPVLYIYRTKQSFVPILLLLLKNKFRGSHLGFFAAILD